MDTAPTQAASRSQRRCSSAYILRRGPQGHRQHSLHLTSLSRRGVPVAVHATNHRAFYSESAYATCPTIAWSAASAPLPSYSFPLGTRQNESGPLRQCLARLGRRATASASRVRSSVKLSGGIGRPIRISFSFITDSKRTTSCY